MGLELYILISCTIRIFLHALCVSISLHPLKFPVVDKIQYTKKEIEVKKEEYDFF